MAKLTGYTTPLFLLAAVITVVVVGAVAPQSLPMTLVVVSVLLIFFSLSSRFIKPKKNETVQSKAQGNHTVSPVTSDSSIDSLGRLDLEIRQQSVPERLQSAFKETTDLLSVLLPKLNEVEPDGELSRVVHRIAEDYLPKRLVRPYLALDPIARLNDQTVDNLMSSLLAMRIELKDVHELILNKITESFAAKSSFLKHRFNIK